MAVLLTRLANGLRVITEERASLQTVSVGAWVGVGSRHEDARIHGISHCLEHMHFKGTEKRSASDIAYEIEAVGGDLNAYTTRDNTVYYARVLKDDLPLALDVLSDILQNSVFEGKELIREKDVICQEIGQANDTPDDIVFDYLQAQCFKGQPLGRAILGTEHSVQALSADDLRRYVQDYYTFDNMVVSAVGALSHETLLQLVEEKFTSLGAVAQEKTEQAIFTGGTQQEARELDQVHLTYGWNGVSFADDDYYAMQVFATILGGGMSSRLFQEIREKRGLAYSVYSFAGSHKDTGVFGIYAGTSPETHTQVKPLVDEQIQALAHSITDAELSTSKAQLKAGLMMALESTTSRMEQLGRQILTFGHHLSTQEILNNVDGVDSQQVRAIADKLLQQSTIATAIVGSIR